MAPVDPVEESEVKLSQNGSASGHAESPTGSPHAGNPASDSVTWASTNNLQDLVAPPDMHVYNSIAGGSGHASTAFIDNSNSNYEGASDEDRDSNRPGTYEFLKYNTRHLTAEVLFCASMGNLRRLKMVLNKAGKTIKTENYADYDKRTPLHIAASDGSVFVTNWLLEQGVDMNPLDRWLMTPLEGAVFGDHQDIVQMMVQAGGMIMDRTTETLVPLEESHLASASASEAKPVLTADLMAWEVPDEELAERTEIGAGAFGVVLKTRWRGTVVAMKQLHRHLHHDEVAKAEFRTELKLMRQLHHPHIVQFLGTSVEPVTGLVSLIFEFMHFGSLDQMFHKAQVPLFKGHAVELALDVARGMSYLHGRKPQPVIHRDLKPGNLMLTRANRLKIGDFGLSKTLSVRNKMPTDIDQNFTMTGETGSYRYMAPEVFRHEYYGPAVDVYAASMIYFQLFCFRQPFCGINPLDAAKMASIDALRPTMSKNLMLPDLARVIRLMWDPDDQRRPTFPQIIQILEPLAEKYQQEDREIAAGGKCCVIQ